MTAASPLYKKEKTTFAGKKGKKNKPSKRRDIPATAAGGSAAPLRRKSARLRARQPAGRQKLSARARPRCQPRTRRFAEFGHGMRFSRNAVAGTRGEGSANRTAHTQTPTAARACATARLRKTQKARRTCKERRKGEARRGGRNKSNKTAKESGKQSSEQC